MAYLSPTIEDAHRRPVPLRPWLTLRGNALVLRGADSRSRLGVVAAWVMMPLVLFAFLWILLVAQARPSGWIFPAAVTLLGAFVTVDRTVRIWISYGQAAFLSAQRCPSCGHSLAGLPPSQTGTVICPECAAAWFVRERGESESP